MQTKSLALCVGLFISAAAASTHWNLALTNSTAGLRGICNAGGGVIWASGTNGTVLRSEDDGYMWQRCKLPPETATLDFRAVHAWDADRAVVMSSGAGLASRLYETTSGGATWRQLLANPDPEGFWDALIFCGKSGFILGDPVNGRFVIYHSDDLGHRWRRDDSTGLAAAPSEGVFAASNSSFVVSSTSQLLFATGGLGGPRVFRQQRSGDWSAVKVPMAGGKDSAGIFSIAFRDSTHGVAVGGDYKKPNDRDGTAVTTSDAGATWQPVSESPAGYRSSVAWDGSHQAWIAVGPNGSDISHDDGRTWQRFDSGDWNALSLPWVVGSNGHIGSLDAATLSLR